MLTFSSEKEVFFSRFKMLMICLLFEKIMSIILTAFIERNFIQRYWLSLQPLWLLLHQNKNYCLVAIIRANIATVLVLFVKISAVQGQIERMLNFQKKIKKSLVLLQLIQACLWKSKIFFLAI